MRPRRERSDRPRIIRPEGAGRAAAAALLLACLPFGRCAAAGAEPCALIEAAAETAHLPAAFLTRLIWQESSFRPHVVSPAGAQGIAQFMPGTAGERGLANPFDPEAAIPKAAELLVDLGRRFGNLGLAAAAYNAGPARVEAWLAGSGQLPAETRAYVLAVTGAEVEAWRPGAPPPPARADASCAAEVATLRTRAPTAAAGGSGLFAPWGVQLTGSYSKAAAVADYARNRARFAAMLGGVEPMVLGGRAPGRGSRPYYRVRAPAASRPAAEQLCLRILRAGGACVVLRS